MDVGISQLNGDVLNGRKVCATGQLASMTHLQLAELVESCGGRFLRSPTRSAFWLIIGDNGWPAERDGSPTQVFERARKLRAYGYDIEFLAEDEFLQRLGLSEPARAIRGQHTIVELTRLLGVPAAQVRRWVRLGLIQPVKVVHRLDYFDFHQVAAARRLCELLADGVSLAEIRRGLQRLGQWLPEEKLPLSQLAMLEHDGRLLMRVGGTLAESTGQQRLDFDEADKPNVADSVLPVTPRNSADELFDAALDLEDAGQFEAAAAAYREAITLDSGDPAIHFNLGNVCFALGQLQPSAESFQLALRLDPQYAEAWNNLGNVRAELGQHDEAIEALKRAVALVPNYADAYFNLAQLLKRIGRDDEAQRYEQAYQRHRATDWWPARDGQPLRIVHADANDA